ncbi:hypothetical protein [Streptosporangium carneum]|uniref:Uncharacterized protein n=1 Tax=Streptosporangium carneum TaxID=47481 RepID=A0A9W6MB23_9ACTN|nr:hypothetical protein [Streptosporangium carneum]GLK07345.1 hypothetical protein GCM10017600_07500 [Streptosporangium carneum]
MTRDSDVIALLSTLYPGWHYEARDLPGLPRWWAHRHQPVTAAQRAAGARASIGRSTPQRLAKALAHHAEILDRVRQSPCLPS